jgi:hypothetical protein
MRNLAERHIANNHSRARCDLIEINFAQLNRGGRPWRNKQAQVFVAAINDLMPRSVIAAANGVGGREPAEANSGRDGLICRSRHWPKAP